MPFPAFSHCRRNFRVFLHVSEIYFNSVNFIFLMLLLFPFQCSFLWELFWFCFTMKVAGAHVHNSWGKSPAPSP